MTDSRTVLKCGQIVMPLMTFKRLHPGAIPPKKTFFLDAGFDLATPHDVTVLPGIACIVPTGLMIKLPHGTYGRIAPRSGHALNGVGVGGGVVDGTYSGEVSILICMEYLE